MEQALAYVCCSAEEGRVKVQKYCKIYELGYVPICPDLYSHNSWKSPIAEDMQGYGRMLISFCGDGW